MGTEPFALKQKAPSPLLFRSDKGIVDMLPENEYNTVIGFFSKKLD